MFTLIKFTFKFIFFFVASYIILSAPIKHKSLFYHLYSFTAPYTQKIYLSSKVHADKAYTETKNFTKKLLAVDVPNFKKEVLDKVKEQNVTTSRSAPRRAADHHKIEESEKEKLQDLLE